MSYNNNIGYGRGGAGIGGFNSNTSGYRRGGYQQSMQMRQVPTMMGMRGGMGSYPQRSGIGMPFGARGGRPVIGAPSFRRDDVHERGFPRGERPSQGLTPYPMTQVQPQTLGTIQPLRNSRGDRDSSRGRYAGTSRTSERSLRRSGEGRSLSQQRRDTGTSTEVRERSKGREFSRPQRERRSRQRSSNLRPDMQREFPNAVWVRSDDSPYFYVKLVK